jgi:hypothetical protein
LVDTGAYPFPSRFTLWLAGLGVEHEFAHCAQEIGGHRYSAGMAYAYQDVKVSFDVDTVEFVVEDSQGEEIRWLKPTGLTVEEITGLGLEPG